MLQSLLLLRFRRLSCSPNDSTPQLPNVSTSCVSLQAFHISRSVDSYLCPFFFYFFGSPATAARRVLKISRDTECGCRYISLFGRCLRLVSYAVRTLPRLWLRAFRPRSSLPSLYYRTAGNSVAAHETTAANDSAGRGGVKRSRLFAILPLTKRREEGIRLRPVSKQ